MCEVVIFYYWMYIWWLIYLLFLCNSEDTIFYQDRWCTNNNVLNYNKWNKILKFIIVFSVQRNEKNLEMNSLTGLLIYWCNTLDNILLVCKWCLFRGICQNITKARIVFELFKLIFVIWCKPCNCLIFFKLSFLY